MSESMLRKVFSHPMARGVTISVADQALVSLTNFLTGVILAKSISPEAFGFYTLLFSSLILLGGLQNSLITGPMRVLGVRSTPQETHDYFAAQFALQTLAAAVLAMTGALVLWVIDVSLGVILPFAASIFFVQMQEFRRVQCLTTMKMQSLLKMDITVYGGRLLLLTTFIYMDLATVGWAFVVIAVTSSAGLLIQTNFGIFRNFSRAALRGFAENWSHARWILLETLVFMLSNQLYVYLVALWLDVKSAGAFGAVLGLINLVNVFISGVANIALRVARQRLMRSDYQSWRRWITQIGWLLLVTTTLTSIGLALFSGPLLSFLYAPFYGQYAFVVPILCLMVMLQSVNAICSVAFRTSELPQAGFMAKATSAIVTCAISYPLLSMLGVAGAAWGLVITQLMWGVVYLVHILRGSLNEKSVMGRMLKTVP